MGFGTPTLAQRPDVEQDAWVMWWAKLERDFGKGFPEAEAVFDSLKNSLNIWHLDLSTNILQFVSG